MIYEQIFFHYKMVMLYNIKMDKEQKLQEEQILSQLKNMKISPEELLHDQIFDKALGALFGAFIGDSLGSFCEFMCQQTEQQMKLVMQMNGGGIWNIQPGQLTDDSEMALHLLSGLLHYNPGYELSTQIEGLTVSISNQYVRWIDSGPFDVGQTCSTGLGFISTCYKRSKEQHIHSLQKAYDFIDRKNKDSISNGSLMRIVPMAIFAAFIKKFAQGEGNQQPLNALIKNQIHLTHSHQIVFQSGKQWVDLISDLINRESEGIEQINQIFQKFMTNPATSVELKDWKKTGIEEGYMLATDKIGFAKIAFSFGIHEAFNIIRKCTEEGKSIDSEQFYRNSIKKVISRGGDTDTNAAIVGGLIGAIVGFKNLPREYIKKQLNLKLDTMRGKFYEPRNGLVNLAELYLKFR